MNKLITPSKKELLWGCVHLLLHLFLLPTVLGAVFSLFSLSAIWQNILYMVLMAGVVLWIFRRYLLESVLHFSRTLGKSLAVAAAGLGIYLLVNTLMNWLLHALGLSGQNLNDAAIVHMIRKALLPMVFCTVVITPLTEEVLYRGILFAGLYRFSRLAAFALSACVFSAIHVLPYLGQYTFEMSVANFLQYLPAGLVLAGSYAIAKNPIVPMLIHCAVNALGILLMFV